VIQDQEAEFAPGLLDVLFRPRSVAVIGASPENTFGGRAIRYLRTMNYGGEVFPINIRYREVCGWGCFPNVSSVPGVIDTAVVAVAAQSAVRVVEELGGKHCRSAVVLSSGFGEAGQAGQALEGELLAAARRSSMRVVGPNCNGLINVLDKIPLGCNSALERPVLLSGCVALVSQSGSLAGSILDAGMTAGIGFSYCAAIGNAADIGVETLLGALAADDATRVVLVLVESVSSGPDLIQSLHMLRGAGKIPIVLKIGRSSVGAANAATHSGRLAGSWKIFRDLTLEAGAIVVDSIPEMITTAKAASSFPLLTASQKGGRRVQILSTSGALCGLVADELGGTRLALAHLGRESEAQLKAEGFAAPFNPLDFARVPIKESEWAAKLARVVDRLLSDPAVDCLLVGSGLSHIVSELSAIVARIASQHQEKLVGVYVVGGQLLNQAVTAVEGKAVVSRDLRALVRIIDAQRSTWTLSSNYLNPTRAAHVQVAPRGLGQLTRHTEQSVSAWLAEYGLAHPRSVTVTSADEAVEAALELGFPVVAKASVGHPVHKSELRLVELDLGSISAVRRAFNAIAQAAKAASVWEDEVLIAEQLERHSIREVLLGLRDDAVFGPHLVIGAGGVLANELDDWVSLSLPARRRQLERALGSLRVLQHLDARDMRGLLRAATAFAKAARDAASYVEILEVNPCAVVVGQGRCLALDARVVMRSASRGAGDGEPSYE